MGVEDAVEGVEGWFGGEPVEGLWWLVWFWCRVVGFGMWFMLEERSMRHRVFANVEA